MRYISQVTSKVTFLDLQHIMILGNTQIKKKEKKQVFYPKSVVHISNQLFLDQDWLTFSELILNDFL